MEQVLTLATFNDRAPAEALKDQLLEEGYHAELMDESGAQSLFFLSREHRAHMRVRVRKEEFDAARRFTRALEEKGLLREAVHCPQCGGSRIEYPQFSRRTAGSIFFALLASAHLIPREYFCEDCQFTWPDKVTPEQPRDALNWPHKSKVP